MICFSYICIITKLNAKFPIILPPRQTKTATNLRQREANELKTKRKGSRRLPVQFVGVEISELQTNLSFIRKIIYAIITHPSRFYCPRPQHFLQRRGLQAGAVLLEGLVLLLEGLAELVDGAVLGRFRLEPMLTPWVRDLQAASEVQSEKWNAERVRFVDRLPSILRQSWDIVRGVLIYVLIGIGIGAAMHGFVPEGFFETWLSRDRWYAVPLAVVCAVPMYANAAGVVPIVEVFVAKGIPIGTAIAFMMAVVGLSLPEATLLKKVMSWRLIGIFFGTVTLFIILSGYLFNWLI